MKQQPTPLIGTHLVPKHNASLKKKLLLARKEDILEHIFLFLLCRISFLGYLLSPFGTTFFGVLYLKKRKPTYILFALCGILSLGYPMFAFKYGGVILILTALGKIFSAELKKIRHLGLYFSAGALFLNGAVYVVSEGFFAYDGMLLLAECCLACLAYPAFQKASELIRGLRGRKLFEQSETVGAVLLLSCVLVSLASVAPLYTVAHILAILAVLFLAASVGFSVACPAGALFGLSIGLCGTYLTQTVCVYCLSSFAAGLLKRFGKIGVSCAFLFTSFFTCLLLCPEANGVITAAYVAVASLLLWFMPNRFLSRFGVSAMDMRNIETTGERMLHTMEHTLTETIMAMDSVSHVFRDVLTDLYEPQDEPHALVFDNTASKVCTNCTLSRYCWKKSREDTLCSMNRLYAILEDKGTVTKEECPEEFYAMCIRKDAFLAELNKNYESFKISRMWAGRVMESKRLVAEQFANVSLILKNMQEALFCRMHFVPEAEEKILAALDRRGISAENVSVYGGDGFSVSLDKVSCGKNLVCSTTVASALSEVLEVPMLSEKRECSEDICHLTYSQKTKFSTDIAAVSTSRKNVPDSGDCYETFSFGNGKIALLLSDGMGSGERAHFLSSVTTRLAKKLLSAGFNKETCIRLINHILMTNADRDTFATIDLTVLNLYTGAMEFAKTGAVNSYVQTKEGTETVFASSLPAGLVTPLEPDYDLRYMHPGDYLVMVSDGVSDVLDTPDRNRIFELTQDFSGTAKELADLILEAALQKNHGIADDDMTVIVCAVLENT